MEDSRRHLWWLALVGVLGGVGLGHLAAPKPRRKPASTVERVAPASDPGVTAGSSRGKTADPAGARGPRKAAPSAEGRVRQSYGRLPLAFEANVGQAPAGVSFAARGAGYSLALGASEAVLSLRGHGAPRSGETHGDGDHTSGGRRTPARVRAPRSGAVAPPAVLRMKVVGADRFAQSRGVEPLPGRVNYLLGSDRRQWRTNVPLYRKVRYESVYPGVDLVYYGNQGALEYDFIVAPAADPKMVRLAFFGARGTRIERGDLVLETEAGPVRWLKPVVYQEREGRRVPIPAAYKLHAKRPNSSGGGADGPTTVGFGIGRYDRSRPLIIDPVLQYSTYFGGTGADAGTAIAVDAAQNAYVAGMTASADLRVTGAAQGANAGGTDTFIAKLNAAGTALVYCTYLGGAGFDRPNGIAVDSQGAAWVAGETDSADFPVANAVQPALADAAGDGFLTKLDPSGGALSASTYLGGAGYDQALGVAVDGQDNAYVTGLTGSADFPTVAPLQAASGGFTDAFLAKLPPAGTSLIYSTYLGGVDDDYGFGVAVDTTGNAYVAGETWSTNFPLLGAFQATHRGGFTEAFVTKVSADGASLAYSSFLGGDVDEGARAVAVDPTGAAYVTGWTTSTNFPRVRAFDPELRGPSDAFVTKVNPDGATLNFSTYLGSEYDEEGRGIGVDYSGSCYVFGTTDSLNHPIMNEIQRRSAGGFDTFLTKFAPDGTALSYSTYLGGRYKDVAGGMAVHRAGNVFLTGETRSSNWPKFRALQGTLAGGVTDAFVAKVIELPSEPREPRWAEGSGGASVALNATWQSPAVIGPGIQSYRVQVKEGSRSLDAGPYVAELSVPGNRLSVALTSANGLRAGRWYSFRVRAINAALNVGPWSEVSPLAGVAMGALTGAVIRRDNGQPLAGAAVQALVHGTQTASLATRADRLGRYSITALPEGTYDLRISHSDATTVTLTNGGAGYAVSGNATTTVNASLAPVVLGSVWGTVRRRPDGANIGGATVRIATVAGVVKATTLTGWNGVYQAPRLAPGNYLVSFTARGYTSPASPTPVTITAGTRARGDAWMEANGTTIPSPTTGALSGLVTDGATGAPIYGARITIACSPEIVLFSDVEGRYLAPSVPTGDWLVTIFKEGYTAASGVNTFTAGTVTGRSAGLQTIATIEGAVTVNGQPGSTTKVTATFWRYTYAAVAGPDGRYQIQLPAGTYTVTAGYVSPSSQSATVAAGGTAIADFAF